MSLPPYPNQNTAHPQPGYAIPNAPQSGQAVYPAGVRYVSFFQEKSIQLTIIMLIWD